MQRVALARADFGNRSKPAAKYTVKLPGQILLIERQEFCRRIGWHSPDDAGAPARQWQYGKRTIRSKALDRKSVQRSNRQTIEYDRCLRVIVVSHGKPERLA